MHVGRIPHSRLRSFFQGVTPSAYGAGFDCGPAVSVPHMCTVLQPVVSLPESTEDLRARPGPPSIRHLFSPSMIQSFEAVSRQDWLGVLGTPRLPTDP